MNRDIHSVLVKALKVLDMEEKRIRRVRTPAGVAHFGQPIGSIIVRDLDGPDKPRRRRSPDLAQTARRTAGSGGSRTVGDKAAWLHSLDDLKWKRQKDGDGHKYVAEHGGMTLNRRKLAFPDDGSDGYSYEVFAGRVDQSHKLPYDVRRGKAPEALMGFLNRIHNFEAPKRTDRKVDSLMDYWEGIYGLDWLHEDDEWEDDDYDDPKTRQLMATLESQEIGINVNFAGTGERGGYVEMDPNVHEMINVVARIMDAFYPGFSKVQNTYAIASKKSRRGGKALAWNGTSPRFETDENGVPTKVVNGTMVSLQASVFKSGNKKNPLADFVSMKRRNVAAGWFSVESIDELSKEYGIEPYQFATMATIVHETGHTVGRMIFGELAGWNVNRTEASLKFQRESGKIFAKYGIIRNESDMNVDTTNIWNTAGLGGGVSRFNRTAILAHLSEYGSTNLHEIMAETWASYMLDPRPTEFVQEFGSMMEELMMDWMEEAGIDGD